MCLTIRGFKTRRKASEFKPLIAKEDIRVYKNLTQNNKSPYYDFKYEKGYHYSVTKLTKNCVFSYIMCSWRINIEKGLHTYKQLNTAINNRDKEEKTVIMYIPKNSVYYLGANGDIVSNNLIWY